MSVEVRIAKRYDGWQDYYVCEVVIGGVIFDTPANDAAHAIQLAARTARELGIGSSTTDDPDALR